MRFRRTFLTALAPLIGMSAWMTAMAGAPEISRAAAGSKALVRLIQTVIHLVTPATEVSAASARPRSASPQSVLPLAALAPTPMGHSLWMLAQASAPAIALRRFRRTQLRC